jgi:transcriptional regulator with XRE-family HTH domain
MMDIELRLRERIASARKDVGASQADLGLHLNLDNTAVSKIEQGKRSISSMELSQIAEFCGKPLSWFFADEPTHVVQFRGVGDGDIASRRDVQWLAEFADAHAYLDQELRNNESGKP